MSLIDTQVFLAVLAIMIAGGWITIFLQQLPRLWKWFRFKVWHDLRYSQGYKEGFADGVRTERGWRDAS